MIALPLLLLLPYLTKRIPCLCHYTYSTLCPSYPTFTTIVTLPCPKVTLPLPSLLPYLWPILPCLCHYDYPTLAQGYPTFY
jgi:hypothetical protein